MAFNRSIIFTLLAGLIFFACSEDSVAPDDGPGEVEVISRVTVTLTDTSNPTNVAAAVWDDSDGDGVADNIGTLTLTAGATYSGTILLENALETPAENITLEIDEEAEEQQFFYSVTGALAGNITLVINDTDDNNYPVGLDYTVAVAAGTGGQTGEMGIILYHYDDVDKDGVSPSNESDIDISIPLTVQ